MPSQLTNQLYFLKLSLITLLAMLQGEKRLFLLYYVILSLYLYYVNKNIMIYLKFILKDYVENISGLPLHKSHPSHTSTL